MLELVVTYVSMKTFANINYYIILLNFELVIGQLRSSELI